MRSERALVVAAAVVPTLVRAKLISPLDRRSQGADHQDLSSPMHDRRARVEWREKRCTMRVALC